MNKFKPILLSSAIALILSGCGESTSSTSGSDFDTGVTTPVEPITFDQKKLLTDLVDNVFTPTFEQFNEKAKAQQHAISSYCELEKAFDPTMGDASALEKLTQAKKAADNSWKDAMVAWQHAEMMIVGPLSANDKELRNQIYSWPNVSTCNVDQDVVYHQRGEINGFPYDIANRSVKRRGLDALEYLLFNETLAHSCTIATAGEVLATWNITEDQARKVARCDYANTVALDLIASSNTLLSAWKGEAGYGNKLKQAGEPGSEITDATKAVNEISNALFYLSEELKDYKLATPLGLFDNNCGREICPENVESKFAKHSIENILANLSAFEEIFRGNKANAQAGIGFDDFLDNQNGQDTRVLMLQGIADAKVATANIGENLQDSLTDSPEKVTDAHGKVKAVTDQLKTDFINKLALELPKTSAGDND
ncbi:Iron-regulated protein A precursor [Pseudoalteromonas luteoviolacea B = ATCC 29581]|nr:Iron-regulated protein A precursor [Pseudoalteromonas luteoviolacea B = ATCC 29581]